MLLYCAVPRLEKQANPCKHATTMLPKVRYGRPTASVVEIVSDSDSDGEPPLKVYRVNGRRSHLAATLLGISGKEYRHMKELKFRRVSYNWYITFTASMAGLNRCLTSLNILLAWEKLKKLGRVKVCPPGPMKYFMTMNFKTSWATQDSRQQSLLRRNSEVSA